MPDTKTKPSTGDSSRGGEVLRKNKAARETVKEAAEDLAVVHAVLDNEIPPPGRNGEVDQAVKQTDKLQKKLDHTANVLHEVNQELAGKPHNASGKHSAS